MQVIKFLFACAIWPLMITLGLAVLWHFDVTMWVTAPVAVMTVFGWAVSALSVFFEARESSDGRGVFYGGN